MYPLLLLVKYGSATPNAFLYAEPSDSQEVQHTRLKQAITCSLIPCLVVALCSAKHKETLTFPTFVRGCVADHWMHFICIVLSSCFDMCVSGLRLPSLDGFRTCDHHTVFRSILRLHNCNLQDPDNLGNLSDCTWRDIRYRISPLSQCPSSSLLLSDTFCQRNVPP